MYTRHQLQCQVSGLAYCHQDHRHGVKLSRGQFLKTYLILKEQKVYVTHHIAENKDSIWQILDGGGHVYVCGYVSVDYVCYMLPIKGRFSHTNNLKKKITKVIFWYAKVEVKNINSNYYYCVGIYHTIWLTGRIKNSMKQLRLQKIYFFKNFVFGISILSPEKPWAL